MPALLDAVRRPTPTSFGNLARAVSPLRRVIERAHRRRLARVALDQRSTWQRICVPAGRRLPDVDGPRRLLARRNGPLNHRSHPATSRRRWKAASETGGKTVAVAAGETMTTMSMMNRARRARSRQLAPAVPAAAAAGGAGAVTADGAAAAAGAEEPGGMRGLSRAGAAGPGACCGFGATPARARRLPQELPSRPF